MSGFDRIPARKPAGGLALTVGVFDGVHKGHQAILKALKRRARAAKLKSAALTFDRHPATVLSPSFAPPPLYSAQSNRRFLAESVDKVFQLRFTRAFSRRTAEDFVARDLVGRLGVKELVIGYDFVFGRRGLGDRYLLAELGKKHGFRLTVARPALVGGEPVSSTRIRSAVLAGEFSKAKALLGRHYRISGKVVRGRGLGAKIGRPTANLDLKEGLLPKPGVWGGKARVGEDGSWMPFVANLGRRPTVERRGALRLELHLLDFEGRLDGRQVQVEFSHYLRGEKKFASLQALTRQIARDEQSFRRRLKRR